MLEKDQDTAVAEMKKRAKILYDVKVGETCVELYVDNRFCRFLGVDDIIEEEEEEKKDDSSESSSSDSEKSEKSDSESEKSNSDSDSEKSDKSDKSDHSDSESHKSTSTSSSSKKKKKKVVKKEEEKEPSPPAELKPKLSKEELEMQHIQAYNEARRNLIASVTDVKKFKSLLNRIQETCLNENEIIAQVFPTNHKDVLVELLLRLMEQIVSKTVENILVQPNVASSDSDALLVYLQNFENIYTECMLFTKELCVNKEIPINESTVTIMIENMFQDRKQNYINVEVGHYDKIHSAKMSELIIEENRVLIEFAQSSKHSSGYFSGLFSSSGQSGITANQAQIINALANASSSNSTNKQFQIPGLKFDIVVTFINENCTALQRCQKLSPIRNL
jgi:chemotaxis protein histidine kinase CheA